MKKTGKIASFITAMLLTASAAFADETVYTFEDLSAVIETAGGTGITFNKQDISNGMDKFGKTLLVAAPESAVQQNVWADAYIGKLFPALPPHFGFGFSVGGTALDMSGLKDAAKAFESAAKSAVGNNVDFGKIPSSFFLPTLSLDARIGGVILPFDIGFSLMMTNPSLAGIDFSNPESILDASSGMKFNWMGFDGSIDYITVGLNARYAIWEGNIIFPKLSVGGGYVYTRGQFGVSSSDSKTKANIDLSYSTHVLYLEAQLSKNFLLATVFAGGRALVSNTTTSWAWNIATSYTYIDVTYTIADGDSGSRTADGKSTTYKDGKFDLSGIQPQLYAGVGLNFLVFQTSLSVCADVRSFFDSSNYDKALWSGAFSFHFKL